MAHLCLGAAAILAGLVLGGECIACCCLAMRTAVSNSRSPDALQHEWLEDQYSPVRVAGGRAFASIAAGVYHTCGITLNTSVVLCWGDPPENGQSNSTAVPTEVGSGQAFVALCAGDKFTCALDTAGDVQCWGEWDEALGRWSMKQP